MEAHPIDQVEATVPIEAVEVEAASFPAVESVGLINCMPECMQDGSIR